MGDSTPWVRTQNMEDTPCSIIAHPNLVVHFELLTGRKILVFVMDRHKGISKWIREKRKDTLHFHDLCYVCKNL